MALELEAKSMPSISDCGSPVNSHRWDTSCITGQCYSIAGQYTYERKVLLQIYLRRVRAKFPKFRVPNPTAGNSRSAHGKIARANALS